MIRRLAAMLLASCFGLTTLAIAQGAATSAPVFTGLMPTDSAVIVGTLSNGIRYYIRKNPRPAGQAQLRLVVQAGSLLEDDDQRGLAHVVEHMAFVGTRHFSRDDLYEYLQRIGVAIGPDVNGYTLWDATVYQLRVPTDTARFMAQAVQVLEDWAHGITFDCMGMERERQRVLKEWETTAWSLSESADPLRPLVYSGSRYAERMSIGTKVSLDSFTRAQVQRFYRDWYRPEFMAVIAVGDFDVKAMERLIRQHFARISRRKDGRPRPSYTPVLLDTIRVAVATVPKLVTPRVSVSWMRARERSEVATVAGFRSNLLTQLYVDMLNDRLADAVNGAATSFRGASVNAGPFVPFYEPTYYEGWPRLLMPETVESPVAPAISQFTLGVEVSDSSIARGLAGALAEVMRAARDGFEVKECDRARRASLRKLERTFTARDTTESASIVGTYINHFMHGESLASRAQVYALRKSLLESATLDDINRVGRAWLDAKDRLIVVTVPDRASVVVPSNDELMAIVKSALALRAARGP